MILQYHLAKAAGRAFRASEPDRLICLGAQELARRMCVFSASMEAELSDPTRADHLDLMWLNSVSLDTIPELAQMIEQERAAEAANPLPSSSVLPAAEPPAAAPPAAPPSWGRRD